ncbi:MAG TPA: hypothetical protein PLZ86_03580 [bacterium]|nr:hypothetical protein [bacterium]
MKRDELLKLLDRADRIEEGAVDSLARHIGAATRWLGCTPEESEQIRRTLVKLEQDSRLHASLLQKIRERIIGEERDVY